MPGDCLPAGLSSIQPLLSGHRDQPDESLAVERRELGIQPSFEEAGSQQILDTGRDVAEDRGE